MSDTFPFPEHGITCFHCGETFTRYKDAALHFGPMPSHEPGCILKLNARDREFLFLLREKDAELWRYHQDDQPIMRELHALGARHARELMDAEQRGYDAGLRDGRGRISAPVQAAIKHDLLQAMSLRKVADKHGVTLGKVRGIAAELRRGAP